MPMSSPQMTRILGRFAISFSLHGCRCSHCMALRDRDSPSFLVISTAPRHDRLQHRAHAAPGPVTHSHKQTKIDDMSSLPGVPDRTGARHVLASAGTLVLRDCSSICQWGLTVLGLRDREPLRAAPRLGGTLATTPPSA